MSIVYLPQMLQQEEPQTCSICQVSLLLSKATAGFSAADNRQAFACVSHFSEVDLLIRGWADFLRRERHRYLGQGKEPNDLTYGEARIDVWRDS
jgi:hypothetical protein